MKLDWKSNAKCRHLMLQTQLSQRMFQSESPSYVPRFKLASLFNWSLAVVILMRTWQRSKCSVLCPHGPACRILFHITLVFVFSGTCRNLLQFRNCVFSFLVHRVTYSWMSIPCSVTEMSFFVAEDTFTAEFNPFLYCCCCHLTNVSIWNQRFHFEQYKTTLPVLMHFSMV